MLRIVMSRQDCNALVAGARMSENLVKTFDVALPELEEWFKNNTRSYTQVQCLGIELIDPAARHDI